MKKTAFLLALCMALSLLVCPVGAAEAPGWDVVWLEPDLTAFPWMTDGLLGVASQRDGYHIGYVDRMGQMVIPDIYYDGALVASFKEGLAGVGRQDPATGEIRFGMINTKGETVVPFLYDDVEGFSEGLACVHTYDPVTQRPSYSYIDKTGAEIIPPSNAYDTAYGFQEGFALVRTWQGEDSLWGMIDKTGKLVIPVEYDELNAFSEGLAAVGKYEGDGQWKRGYLNPDGSWNMYTYGDAYLGDFSEGLATIQGWNDKGKWQTGYIDKDGHITLPLEYVGAGDFHQGRAVVADPNAAEDQSKYGFIDRTGQVVIPYLYDGAKDFSEGLAAVCRREGDTEKWGFVDRDGREVVPLCFDEVCSFSEGVAVVSQGDRAGILSLRRTAYERTQSVEVDGKAVAFEMYALKDSAGNETNYVKVRDVAQVLNGTPAQFSVDWSGGVELARGRSYTPNGSEMSTPYDGDRSYHSTTALTTVDGVIADLDAILLTDDQGGGYTYYKLRDLGKALGFNVGWTGERGVYLETDRPYQG